jgi:hypothetical protein
MGGGSSTVSMRGYGSHNEVVSATTRENDATIIGVFSTLFAYSPSFANGVISFHVVSSYGFFTIHDTLKLAGLS